MLCHQNKSNFSLEYLFHQVYQSKQCGFSRGGKPLTTKSSMLCVLPSLTLPMSDSKSTKICFDPIQTLSITFFFYILHFWLHLEAHRPCTGDPRKGGEHLLEVFEPVTPSRSVPQACGDGWDVFTPTFSLLLCAVRDLWAAPRSAVL